MRSNIKTILLILAVFGGLLVVYQSWPTVQKTTTTPADKQQVGRLQAWDTKTDQQADVTVAVTPRDLSPQSGEWKFDIGMDTHSVELNQDMAKSAVLLDDQGTEYTPIAWEGPVGGHHRQGILIFKSITPAPGSVQLKISGIGDVIRIFNWQLK